MRTTIFERERDVVRLTDLTFFRVVLGVVIVLLILEVLFPVWKIVPLIYGQPTVPLHYNIHMGVDRIGAWWRIFLAPAISFVFLVVNVIAAQIVFKKEPVLVYFILSATLLAQIFSCVSMLFIVLFNYSYG